MNEEHSQGMVTRTDIRIAQAEQLKRRIVGSCVFVEMIIFYIATMLMLGGDIRKAVIWLSIASSMVAITFAYSKLTARSGVTLENVDRYLIGHVFISSATGIVWGALAIYFVDWESAYSLFIASVIVCTVILGGIMPGATYSPGFIGLATCMLIPFGVYVLLFADGPFRLAGFGVILLYVFGMISSLHAQRNSNDGIFARQLQELNGKIRTQNEIIKRANEEKTRFLAATSHDFSQPLHAQGYFIEALRQKLDRPDQQDLLKKIESSWQHQKRLIRGIVEINQLDSGTIVPKLKPVDLESISRRIIDEFDTIADDRKIKFKVSLTNATVFTDPLLLARVIQNILSNAFRYTPEDGEVELAISQSDGIATIAIRDTGPGIPEDQHARIFEEYVQLRDAPREGAQIGLGLGLSIVRRLSDLLDLNLELTSKQGDGSTFVLNLPVHTSPHTQLNEGSLKHDEEASTKLIILVDDEITILQSMSALLEGWGYELIAATGPNTALTRLAEIEDLPALLIVDKRLGNDQNGLDLIQKLREEVNQDTPAILMSGDLTVKAKDIDLEHVQFMPKPIDPEIIRQMIIQLTASK